MLKIKNNFINKNRPTDGIKDLSLGVINYNHSSSSSETESYEADNETDDEGNDISWGFLEGG